MRGFQQYAKKNHGMRPSRPRNGRPKTREHLRILNPAPRTQWDLEAWGGRVTQNMDGDLVFKNGVTVPRGRWQVA